MADNFEKTVDSLFKGMDSFITTKTVVGEAITVGDGTIILPLVDVSFGVAAGAFVNAKDTKNNGGGGMGGKIQPSAVIVLKDGEAKLVNIKNQDLQRYSTWCLTFLKNLESPAKGTTDRSRRVNDFCSLS